MPCISRPRSELFRPEAYTNDADEVLAVAQGAWLKQDELIEIERRELEPSYGEPADARASAEAFEECASVRVPITLFTHHGGRDAGLLERQEVELVMFGHALAPDSSNPTTFDELTYEGQRVGFPIARDMYFAPDGTLWEMGEGFVPEQIGARAED
jgi:hypothetical protein